MILAAAWVLLVASRIFGASDLYDREQPRTVSYTADLLVHHHWIMQYDTFGIPQTKPPLYNWVGASMVAAFGFQEWALKMPSILSSVAVIAIIMLFGRWMQSQPGEPLRPDERQDGELELALSAALLWIATYTTSRLIYMARPDMILTACLTGAWYTATLLVQPVKPAKGTALLYWLCTIGAAFAKGPMVLLALLYLPLAAKWIGGSWKLVHRSGWWWGLPLLAGVCGAWGLLAYQREPEFFRQVFLGREMEDRAADPNSLVSTFFHGPLYVLLRFAPGPICTILLFIHVPVRKWFKHPTGPALLWIWLILVVYSFASTKRPDRYAPIAPAIALTAAYYLLYCIRKFRVNAAQIGAGALGLVAALGVYNLFYSEATPAYGNNLVQFAGAVRKTVGRDVVLFEDGEQTPLETLLGRAQEWPASMQTQSNATWSVHFYEAGSHAVLVSEPIDQVDGKEPGRLGLYRLKPGEGVAEYQASLKIPIAIADVEAPINTGVDPTLNHAVDWRQLWHLHGRNSGGMTQR